MCFLDTKSYGNFTNHNTNLDIFLRNGKRPEFTHCKIVAWANLSVKLIQCAIANSFGKQGGAQRAFAKTQPHHVPTVRATHASRKSYHLHHINMPTSTAIHSKRGNNRTTLRNASDQLHVRNQMRRLDDHSMMEVVNEDTGTKPVLPKTRYRLLSQRALKCHGDSYHGYTTHTVGKLHPT